MTQVQSIAQQRMSWRQRGIAFACLSLAAALVVVLYVVKPDGSSLYPKCTLHWLTGLDCPGCGATRALNRLLHGEFMEAWRFNPLFVSIVLPCIAYWAARFAWGRWRGISFPSRLLPNWATWTLLVVVAIFGVVRNTPMYPWKTSALGKPALTRHSDWAEIP